MQRYAISDLRVSWMGAVHMQLSCANQKMAYSWHFSVVRGVALCTAYQKQQMEVLLFSQCCPCVCKYFSVLLSWTSANRNLFDFVFPNVFIANFELISSALYIS